MVSHSDFGWSLLSQVAYFVVSVTEPNFVDPMPKGLDETRDMAYNPLLGWSI